MSKHVKSESDSDSDSDCTMEEDNDFDDDADYETYEFHTKNINPSLAKLCGIPVSTSNSDTIPLWKPPATSGLENSEAIAHSMHFRHIKHALEFDYTRHIHNCIVDMQTLTPVQLQYVSTLDNETLVSLIETYNMVLTNVIQFVAEPME